MGTLAAGINFILALVKLGLGLVTGSLWLLLFGGYYLILSLARSSFLHHYSRSRQYDELPETKVFVQTAGLAYVVLGLAFTICAFIMYHDGYQARFGKITAITVAIIGFLRVRRLHHGALFFLKTFNLADGAMAIVLTQYALLSAQQEMANQVTGIFGMGVGSLLVLIGLGALISIRFTDQTHD